MCNIFCSIHWTYPFENEQYKGKHHWRILAVVHVIRVIVIFLPFPCPWTPGTEDYHGSPDDHRKLDDERDHKTEPQNELTGVALSVAHNLTQSVDDCGDVWLIWSRYSDIETLNCLRPGNRFQPRTTSWQFHWDMDRSWNSNLQLFLQSGGERTKTRWSKIYKPASGLQVLVANADHADGDDDVYEGHRGNKTVRWLNRVIIFNHCCCVGSHYLTRTVWQLLITS